MISDFTQPYIESGLVVVASIRRMESDAWAFLKPFTPMMWGVTALFFLTVGAVVWILEHRINDEFRGPPRQQIVTILWQVYLKTCSVNLFYPCENYFLDATLMGLIVTCRFSLSTMFFAHSK